MVAPGRGILAADESAGTIEKRFRALDVPSTEVTRREYRELLFSTPGLGAFIGGVILFEETLEQTSAAGVPLPQLLVAQGIVPGIDAPVAAVGVAEKGYVSVELTAEMPGGHSSTPPRETAIGVIAAAVGRLEGRPPDSRLDGVSRQMLEEGVGPEARFPHRLVMANLWLFGPLVERLLAGIPAASATIRTTTAVTIFEAGVKDNVIPSRARAVVNFRILPGDSIASVVAHVNRTVDDERVRVEALPKQREPSPPSVTEGEAWDLLARSIREVQPDAVVTPYLMLAGTDSRHFRGLTDAVYRFMPVRLALDDIQRIHGTNERISIEGYADGVRIYRRLLENAVR